ncbi:MAG: hypothetical protein QME44_09085 [Thermodesulfobacteriota bacterium]|nr:hypothetical protein [Thermodesulfobacteriota bacterium]
MSEPGVKHIDFKALVEALDPNRHKPIKIYEFKGCGGKTRKFFEEELKPGETYPWAT